MKSDDELIKALIPQWHSTRKWAEELLCRSFSLTEPQQILDLKPKNVPRPIPGTNWTFRTHGIGIDIDRGFRCGGIDFDFDKPDPDPWRLEIYAEKQFNAGILPEEYRALIDDADKFREVAARVLEININK